jgi:hypothetical protein
VIAVGATTTGDAIASFSNASPLLDLLAPGVGVASAAIGDGTTTASGTSMASPLSAGCAALLIASGEAVTPAAVEAWLEASPVHLLDGRNGTTYPRLVCAPTPPAALAVSGPTEGETDAATTLVAAVAPLTTTVPLTYTWQVTGETTLQHTAGLTDTATFTWTSPGLKLVAVTASDGTVTGTVTGTHTVDVVQAVLAPAGVSLAGPNAVVVNTAATFTAAVAPISATVPLTYVWEVAGQVPITHSGGLSDTLTLTWSTPGTRTVSVTASNGAGAASDSVAVLVEQRVYLPNVRR